MILYFAEMLLDDFLVSEDLCPQESRLSPMRAGTALSSGTSRKDNDANYYMVDQNYRIPTASANRDVMVDGVPRYCLGLTVWPFS